MSVAFGGREAPPGALELLAAVRAPVQEHLRSRGVVAHPHISFA